MIDAAYVEQLKERYPSDFETQSAALSKQRGALLAPEEQDFVGVRVAYGIRYWLATEVGRTDKEEVLALFVEILEEKLKPMAPFLIDSAKFTPSTVQKVKTSTDRVDGMILHPYSN